RLLAPPLVPLLSPADDADRDARAGGGIRLLRWCTGGLPLRPDEGRQHRRRAPRRWPSPGESGVRPLRRPLGLPDPCLPAVPGTDEGEGGASDSLPAAELPLWSRLPGRR